ncbi:hypothetical protein [Saccharothrix algeriensis]|uniref:DUF3592 domain-containing protein n=1 Tax=Saccharothrix algeriensis TaxID=173560 RepID=A0A8T8HXB7_9PSEU|nr:hypothetical protein [Saccharothrix algeriensis]MBM7814559.1 hypothetical protein [Saccharothrix algeriensis]QTR02850.1 hypothetical protein J7S33_28165 [Saccharothrix algeriensis]
MRGLRLFGLLCAGVVVLVVCWLLAFATLAGLILQPRGALWVLLGIPLVAVLLLFGFGLAIPFEEAAEPHDGGLTGNVLIAFFYIAFGALAAAGSAVHFSGAQVYHVHFGERVEAVVSGIHEVRNEYGSLADRWYHVADSTTRESLGQLAVHPSDETAEGDRIEVSVDPHGWLGPVPVDRMGWSTVPTAVLVGCAGAVALAALAAVATAFGVWVRAVRRGCSASAEGR